MCTHVRTGVRLATRLLMLFLVRIMNPHDIKNAEMYLTCTIDNCLGLIIFILSTFNSQTLDLGLILLCEE